jgi:hypothetical protein
MRARRTAHRFAILGAILSVFLTASALRAQAPQCSNDTMKGVYVMSGTGTVVGVGLVAVVGKVTYDGQGGGQALTTQSVNGTVQRQVASTGSFTVNPDCTGSKTFGGTAHFDFMITPDGKTITWIRTDSGLIVTGVAVRMAGREF